MPEDNWQRLIEKLRGAPYQFGVLDSESPTYRVDFAPGLRDSELDAIEERFGFRFPADLCAFLRAALPQGPKFPDWRGGDYRSLRTWLDAPRDGVLFDVQHNAVWLDIWGPRPPVVEDAVAVASNHMRNVPQLIPIYGHRMIPAEPSSAGNPILSVSQSDIIRFADDLADYFHIEFRLPGRRPEPGAPRPVPFWDLLVS